MTDAGRSLFEKERTSNIAWEDLHPLGRKSYDNRAAGSLAKPELEEVSTELSLSDAEVWALRHAIVYWRLAEPGEIPRGATTVLNAAIKAGWDVRAGYMRGVWPTSRGPKLVDPTKLTAADDEDEEDAVSTGKYFPGVYQAISLQGRKDGRRFRAWWYWKRWTKETNYKFVGSQLWPGIGQGGLHNSKALTSYIKREDD